MNTSQIIFHGDLMTVVEKRRRQREADKRYALRHPDRLQEKEKRRWRNNRTKESKRNRKYHLENQSRINLRTRLRRHKLTHDEYEALLRAQNYRCAICRKKFDKTPHIDHRHSCCALLKSCNKCRRGLLCDDCNLGLGRFKDNARFLLAAIQYLKDCHGFSI